MLCVITFGSLHSVPLQILGMLNHSDSPYIRGLGFMYLRYTQPSANLWDWFYPYMEDEEVRCNKSSYFLPTLYRSTPFLFPHSDM